MTWPLLVLLGLVIGFLLGCSGLLVRRKARGLHPELGRVDSLLDRIHDGVVVLGQQGEVLTANQRAAEFLGLDRPETGKKIRLALLRNPDLSGFLEKVREGRAPEGITVEAGYPQVRNLRVQASSIPSGGGTGGPFLLLTLTDVTRLHQLEKIRRQFTADLSHEIRTPVTSIRLMAEDMERAEQVLPDHIQRILREAGRLERLVNEILDLSRLEAGEERLDYGPFISQELLDEALDRVGPRASRQGVGIEVEAHESKWWGDYDKLLRVVEIYLDNALKYSPPGSCIKVRSAREGSWQVLRVSDQGPGIPYDEKPHVFQRFYKGQRQEGNPGFGLGLAIAKHVVAQHGGQVFVESRVGEGSEFGFRIPAGRGDEGE